ncbi:S-layer family protein [Nodularia harveyana UHCC-0300]|uniref:S-layer family protein n=1 Tax=Nodularia harveyana UHCC-0300 TaxID=2974287 RepID=A0ABU5U949_9CYAN|nr:S-layer family protein [Nodularia harveyana]MEA5580049.1 S-layer family protein [Nodularia harveyana UHCC-0300]
MKLTFVCLGLISGILTGGIIFPANAQVTSDGTTNTIVNPNGNNFNILNGIEKGNNLFHSFSNFSLPTGSSATFNLINTPNIITIFSRVTGGNISNIDGLIQTLNGNNPASLFLMNPNGIVFGENASLNIGGSFVGTTANSIKFADGAEFSAVNASGTPLLTMSVPIGLQMGQNSGDIQVQGSGHQLTGGAFTPVIRDNTQSTLEVNSGKAIALVGQNVTLSGGVLTAENGRIELGAVKAGTVNINDASSNLQLDYDANIENFGDIQLLNQSLVDASGLTSRGIQLQGQNISLKDGSVALIQTTESQAPSSIRVRATGYLDLSGDVRTAPDVGIVTGVISSRLITESLGLGKGADIDVSAGDLLLNDGGIVLARNYGFDSGGNINVNISRDIQINRVSPLNLIATSGIATPTFGSGPSGNINITASNLTITDGGLIISNNFGKGDTGNVNVNVSRTIEVKGIYPITLAPANISSSVFGQGNSGYLNINTSRLIVNNSGSVSAATLNSGAGGNLTINASESIEFSNGSISAAAPILPITLRQAFGLPDRPSGNAGNATINTPTLQIDNGSLVTVNNEGLGNGGILTINANSLRLNNQGKLIANTASGEGGNINLNLQSDLILRNNSLISTEALGTGNGGNITINSPIIAGLENSDIIANAVQGNGGNIQIATEGIFGLQFRNELTSENDITASSEFGVSGTVQINNIGIDPNSGLIELPANLVDSSQKIAAGCAETSGSSFIATGRGGIPQNPNQDVRSDRTWSDVRNISAFQHKTSPVTAKISETPAPLVQATSWRLNAQGKIELVADESIAPTPQLLTCATVTKN